MAFIAKAFFVFCGRVCFFFLCSICCLFFLTLALCGLSLGDPRVSGKGPPPPLFPSHSAHIRLSFVSTLEAVLPLPDFTYLQLFNFLQLLNLRLIEKQLEAVGIRSFGPMPTVPKSV